MTRQATQLLTIYCCSYPISITIFTVLGTTVFHFLNQCLPGLARCKVSIFQQLLWILILESSSECATQFDACGRTRLNIACLAGFLGFLNFYYRTRAEKIKEGAKRQRTLLNFLSPRSVIKILKTEKTAGYAG